MYDLEKLLTNLETIQTFQPYKCVREDGARIVVCFAFKSNKSILIRLENAQSSRLSNETLNWHWN